jgi:asparagine synthase (glutamine-hydrolysing)
MCGIAAIYDPDGPPAIDVAPALLAALRHRGPDGEGMVQTDNALLLHTRLSIIDVEGGKQPITSEDGATTVVVNGEIYNHLELRRELQAKGHRYATHSDCEAVVHAYEEWGLDSLRRLNGMFAFALWDDRKRTLLLARDALGVKPLYWWSDGRRLAAASEIRALLATGDVTPEIDAVALDHFLSWRFVPAPRTLFRGVSKLAAASALVVGTDGMRVLSYREAPGEPLTAGAHEIASELRERLVAAILRQTMSDVPYGAFLSGGLDSATVVAAMASAGGEAPSTFTIGFPGYGDAIDERAAAKETANLLASRHRDTTMDAGAFLGALSRSVLHLEEPCGIPSAPALMHLSQFTRQHVKVVLSGQGADEPLGGYPRHRAAAALHAAGRLPDAVVRLAGTAIARLPRNERAKRAVRVLGRDPSDALLKIFEITDPVLRSSLGRGSYDAAEERESLARDVLTDVSDRDVLEQALYLDTHLFLPDGLLVYGDKMSMAHGLEQRVPFLDVELLRFVETIPSGLRVSRLRNKWVYRQALTGLLPAEILRRKKRPFSTPYDSWLRSSLGAEVERRYSESSTLDSWIDPEVVKRIVSEHATGREDHKRVLYCLLELAHWSDCFLDADHLERNDQPGLEAQALGG